MSESVKPKLAAIILLAILASGVAFGGQVDSRFDGRWTGVETLQYHDSVFELKGKPPQFTTMLGIADSGKLFGILAGFAPGRYAIADKSHGNTIWIYSALRSCKFVLSSDENTIKEDGRVAVSARGAGVVSCTVWATFHRAGK